MKTSTVLTPLLHHPNNQISRHKSSQALLCYYTLFARPYLCGIRLTHTHSQWSILPHVCVLSRAFPEQTGYNSPDDVDTGALADIQAVNFTHIFGTH